MTSGEFVAEICLHGNPRTSGTGFNGRTRDGCNFGTGGKSKTRSFSEAIRVALGIIRAMGFRTGNVVVYDVMGRVALVNVAHAFLQVGELRFAEVV